MDCKFSSLRSSVKRNDVRFPSARGRRAHLVDTPLLRRPGLGERIARVKVRVAKREVDRPAVFVGSRLGDDLDAAASLPRELRGIRILIQLDLLDRRRRDSDLASLHAVDYERDTSGRGCVEKPRERADDVAIEDGQASQVVIVHHNRVTIGVGRRRDEIGVDGDLLRLRRESEHDRLGRDWAPGGHSDLDPGGTEAFELDAERVPPGATRSMTNSPLASVTAVWAAVGSALVGKFHPRILEHGAGLIADDSVQRRQIRRSILHEPEEEDDQGSSRHISRKSAPSYFRELS